MGLTSRKWGWGAGIVLGLAVGAMLGGLWPSTPLHAVATDRTETFAMATGFVDEGVEALYFLDFLTGDLGAVVIGRGGPTGWMPTGLYAATVLRDLNLNANQNPKFLMVTGVADLIRGGSAGAQVRPSRAVVYVAEITTGRVAAYAIPWNANAHLRNQMVQMPLQLVARFPFRGAAGTGAAAKGKDNTKE
ncbi:MAG: hypothetical protein ABSG86_21785 [Thermoguttaceae bacterium]|jgi:hypothetical protein